MVELFAFLAAGIAANGIAAVWMLRQRARGRDVWAKFAAPGSVPHEHRIQLADHAELTLSYPNPERVIPVLPGAANQPQLAFVVGVPFLLAIAALNMVRDRAKVWVDLDIPPSLSVAPTSLTQPGFQGAETGDRVFDTAVRLRGATDELLARLSPDGRTALAELVRDGAEIRMSRLTWSALARRTDVVSLQRHIDRAARVAQDLAHDDNLAARLAERASEDPNPSVRVNALATLVDRFPTSDATRAAILHAIHRASGVETDPASLARLANNEALDAAFAALLKLQSIGTAAQLGPIKRARDRHHSLERPAEQALAGILSRESGDQFGRLALTDGADAGGLSVAPDVATGGHLQVHEDKVKR